MKNAKKDYVIRVMDSPLEVNVGAWNALLALQTAGGVMNPFMRHEYLAAMHTSASASPKTGWTPRFITLWNGDELAAACALYLKDHSYGEYVFDHAWANAYHQHGLPYYPKALIAPPFTPVPGPRLLARNAAERLLLTKAVISWCEDQKLSSLHLLFNNDDDVAACEEAGLMLRHTVQFHWTNMAPTLVAVRAVGDALPLSFEPGANFPRGGPSERGAPTLVAPRTSLPPEGANFPRGGPSENCRFKSFDDFLMSLAQDKRKKIRQERKKVSDAGITFRWALGKDIANDDWDFFYRCYERTYYEHGNAPYLSRSFFKSMQTDMPENWLMFIAEHGEGEKRQSVATSLIAVSAIDASANSQNLTAYGRYWGALARVDCLHFEACYYQPLQWCIEHGYTTFEGGAQGEHKMARALLPVKTTSAHWLAHPSFADAIERFLEREGAGIENYMGELEGRSPFKQT